MYCVKCKNKTETKRSRMSSVKTNVLCLECCVWEKLRLNSLGFKGADLVSFLNALTSDIMLPWPKYSGEMHLP